MQEGMTMGMARMRCGQRRGFTLIELLIVVAIIAILAAIAVPNFLHAQLRAKVARCQADFHTLQLAIEAYRTDNDTYPMTSGMPWFTAVAGTGVDIRLWCLTYPIPYIKTLALRVFPTERAANRDGQLGGPATFDKYDYYSIYHLGLSQPDITDRHRTSGGEWRVSTAGPDRYHTFGEIQPEYDPTNGDICIVGPPAPKIPPGSLRPKYNRAKGQWGDPPFSVD